MIIKHNYISFFHFYLYFISILYYFSRINFPVFESYIVHIFPLGIFVFVEARNVQNIKLKHMAIQTAAISSQVNTTCCTIHVLGVQHNIPTTNHLSMNFQNFINGHLFAKYLINFINQHQIIHNQSRQ